MPRAWFSFIGIIRNGYYKFLKIVYFGMSFDDYI